jgi:predicted regulator of Ras-like GTPase activity (Roadblock/LC7/MglB family)
MSVADLIQHNCQDRKTARLALDQNGLQAELFFKEGAVVHAALGDQTGEEVIYQVLRWTEGQFNLQTNVEPPTVTIERSWSGLLLEGARRLDEEGQVSPDLELAPEPEAGPPKKSQLLAQALANLLETSGEIDGAAVVGVDGLIYAANVPQRALDESMVGAISAAILGLSRRSVQQLKRGNFNQTFIQGTEGNILVVGLNPETLFIGLTPKEINLGMTFAEARQMSAKLREIL